MSMGRMIPQPIVVVITTMSVAVIRTRKRVGVQ